MPSHVLVTTQSELCNRPFVATVLTDAWLHLRTSYTQSLSMGPSHGIYGGIGTTQVNRRYTAIIDTVTLFSFYYLTHTHTHTRKLKGLHKQSY
jgi:hypothetical protein